MNTASGWVRARGQLAFLTGLIAASAVVISIERRNFVPVADIVPPSVILRPVPGEAKAPWAYIERNTDPRTGLVSSSERSGWTTVAGAGYAVKAALAAHRLGMIDGKELYTRVDRLLATVSAMSPSDAARPISTATGKPIDGTTAGSIAPLVSALELVVWGYPATSSHAASELARWTSHPGAGAHADERSALRDAVTAMIDAATAGDTR